ncbi:hypothetical protein ACFX1T_046866 [Malus domestica]
MENTSQLPRAISPFKIGLNGVDNGRIWFDNVRIPRENLLNSVADVSPDGKYLSATFEICSIHGPIDMGSCNYSSQCRLLLTDKLSNSH